MRVIFALLGLIVAINGLPIDDTPKYAMVPDGDGYFHLVDLNEEPEPENRFVPSEDMNFFLFTRQNPTTFQTIRIGDTEGLLQSNFNPANPTRFIIHGWNNNGQSEVNVVIRTAFLERGEFNVFAVDWGAGSQTINYAGARQRVGPVGAQVADFIRFLNDVHGIDPLEITVVGHSLGGHAAGFVGKNVFGNLRLGVISALDAAGPLFDISNPNTRVSSDDAEYVESIHTNGGVLGMMDPLGDASFYPNYGRTQPGCLIDAAGICSHNRVFQFYAESITTNTHFWSRQCQSMNDILQENCIGTGVNNKMAGEPADTAARGVYWLETNRSSPFAVGA